MWKQKLGSGGFGEVSKPCVWFTHRPATCMVSSLRRCLQLRGEDALSDLLPNG